jgi:hypothetical protein
VSLFTRTLKLRWQYKAGALIWRIHPAVRGRIMGEERDLERKQVSFFAINMATGAVLWHKPGAGDPWWVGMDRVAEDYLFLHGFATPDLPVQRGVTVYAAATGEHLWSRAEWSIERLDEGSLTVREDRRDGSVLLLVDPRTGSVLSEGRASDRAQKHTPQPIEDVLAYVGFPVVLSSAELPAHESGGLVAQQWPVDRLAGPIEIFEHPAFVIMAAHERKEEGAQAAFVHHLRVVRRNTGALVYRDILAASATGLGMDAFFVQDNTLIFVRERRTLCAVGLGE